MVIALFEQFSPRVYAYARRHGDRQDARDVVADVFVVAWRRRDDVPDAALPWLLVVARNVLGNRRRADRRRARLTDAMTTLDRLARPATSADESVEERKSLLAAAAGLTEREREALLLVAWDGLSNRDAARVLGCSLRAFEVRLSRARARLASRIAESSDARVLADPGRTPRPIVGPHGGTEGRT